MSRHSGRKLKPQWSDGVRDAGDIRAWSPRAHLQQNRGIMILMLSMQRRALVRRPCRGGARLILKDALTSIRRQQSKGRGR